MDALPRFIDRDWMADALAQRGIAGDATLVDIDFVGWIGTGQMARNGRIQLHWDDPQGRPTSVVAKVPSPDPDTAAFAFAHGGYLTELQFYEEIAATLGCRVPRCLRTEYRPEDHEFVLLMEDIVGATQGDQFTGLTSEQLDLTISQAVALHAPRHQDPSLPSAFGIEGDPSVQTDALAEFAQSVYAPAVDAMVDRLGSGLDDEVTAAFRSVAPEIGRWTRATGDPDTVIHGDLRADNLLFGSDEGAPPIVVVDWQTVRLGNAGIDVAYLIAGSIADPHERATTESELVDSYLDRMAEAGVVLDRRAFWDEYRLGSVWGLMVTAVATMQAARTDRGDALFTLMAQRHGWQAVDLDPLSLLH